MERKRALDVCVAVVMYGLLIALAASDFRTVRHGLGPITRLARLANRTASNPHVAQAGELRSASFSPEPGALTPKPNPSGRSPLHQPTPSERNRLEAAYGRLPLSFEVSRQAGRGDGSADFFARAHGYTLFLGASEAVFRFAGRTDKPCDDRANPQGSLPSLPAQQASSGGGPAPDRIVRMRLEGANPAPRVTGLEPLTGRVNYFIGKNPRSWRTRIPTFAKVRYYEVYPGIDLAYHGNQGQLEYDFVVAPGADPEAIRLQVAGGGELKLDAQGDLVLGESGRQVFFHKPRVYQEAVGKKQSVSGRYRLLASGEVGFQLGAYDHSRTLVIDPVLSYSTYLGASSFDQGDAIAVDSSGNAYVAGYTSSSSFPTTGGTLDTTLSGATDIFVTKFSASGSGLVYSTYFGGSAPDQATGIAIDGSGDAYITGQTYSSDFPTTAGALRSAYSGNGDAFVTKLSANGSSLVYSTYLGGSGLDEALGIAVDGGNNIYLTGKTFSKDFPTLSALQPNSAGTQNAFVTELNANGSLVYSTYLGGSNYDQGNSVAVDLSGDAYVTGNTNSLNFPTANAIQGTCVSCPNLNDAFVAEISTNGTGLVYSTYLGGSAGDEGMGIAVDDLGNAYVTGLTYSADFPTTPGALQQTLLGTASAFVTQIGTNGTFLGYSTYLGGNGYSFGESIAVFGGNAYVTGETTSTNFPLVSATQTTNAGVTEAFVSELNSTGSGLAFSTYLGGSAHDEANAVAVDVFGNAYVTGATLSSNFPTANTFDATFGGGNADAFVTKIGVPPPPVTLSPASLTFSSQQVGTTSPSQALTLTNSSGATVTGISVAFTGTNSGDFGQTNTCGTSVTANASCSISVTFAPTATGTRTATLTVTDSATNSPQTAGLTGTGTAPTVGLSPTSLTFSNQNVGTASAAQAVTLTNALSTPLSISGIAITGTNSGDFGETDTCGISLAANSSCTINVTFTPTATGTRTATLTVTDNASNSPQTASLTGTGVITATLSPTSLTFLSQNVGTTSLAQTLTLTNSSSTAVSSILISFTGTNSSDFGESDNCGTLLAANSSCTINVTFTPTAIGTRTATLNVTDSATNSPQTASLTGTAVASAVSLSPTSLTFSSQNVATTSAAQAVTLTNAQSAPLSISGIAITGTNSGDFGETDTCGTSLAANSSCTINVTFTPTATGTRTATLTVTDNASNSPQTASLTGTGVITATLSPTSLTFLSQNVGTTSLAQTLTLTNASGTTVSSIVVSITGTNSGDFGQANTCGNSLAANSSCTINVTFAPTANGTRTATLTVTDNASNSPQTASLTGTATAPTVNLSSNNLSFGKVKVGTTSSPKTVTLTNSGTGPLTIAGITIGGTNPGEFAQTNNCPLGPSTLAAGASCSISVTFTPAATGPRSAALSITDNASGSPQQVNLKGSGG